jgi:endonuclease/exonuclease/phosphatase (EEP) superfamily protein YafD
LKYVGYALLAAAVLMLVAVLVSLSNTDAWYVRQVDLVREPMSYIAGVLLLLSLFVKFRWRWVTVALFALIIVINLWRIWPYTFLAGTQLAYDDGAQAGAATCFTAMSVNVKVENDRYAQIADQIERIDPDILFLMETDEEWAAQLEPVLAGYEHVDRHPQPNAFGLVFATRLRVIKTNIVENTHRDTPTLYATVQPGSRPVEFIGLHPKPPLPSWNTQMRDENIVKAGVQTPDRLPDAMVMGDFNDVPWSRTTTKFRDTGEWRDPRIGRGTYPTFPPSLVAIGWPLDQMMLKGDLELTEFEVLPDNGSDHRALYARVCAP